MCVQHSHKSIVPELPVSVDIGIRGESFTKQYLRSSRNSGILILCNLRVGGARTHFFVCIAKVIVARTVKWSLMVDGTTVHVDTEFSV